MERGRSFSGGWNSSTRPRPPRIATVKPVSKSFSEDDLMKVIDDKQNISPRVFSRLKIQDLALLKKDNLISKFLVRVRPRFLETNLFNLPKNYPSSPFDARHVYCLFLNLMNSLVSFKQARWSFTISEKHQVIHCFHSPSRILKNVSLLHLPYSTDIYSYWTKIQMRFRSFVSSNCRLDFGNKIPSQLEYTFFFCFFQMLLKSFKREKHSSKV